MIAAWVDESWNKMYGGMIILKNVVILNGIEFVTFKQEYY